VPDAGKATAGQQHWPAVAHGPRPEQARPPPDV